MSDYFSLLQSNAAEAGAFKTFSTFNAKRAYKYGFFCFGKSEGFVTLCAFNEAADIDSVFGCSYSVLISSAVEECVPVGDSFWLRVW